MDCLIHSLVSRGPGEHIFRHLFRLGSFREHQNTSLITGDISVLYPKPSMETLLRPPSTQSKAEAHRSLPLEPKQ